MKKTPLSFHSSSSSTPQTVKPRNLSQKTSKGTSPVSPSNASTKNVSGTPVNATHSTTAVKDKKCHQELELLKKENDELKAELLFIKSLYHQLVEEVPSEKFDERRVNLLKSQVIQLERQVLLQCNALSSRANVLLEVENRLSKIKETLRGALASTDISDHVTLPRDYFSNLTSAIDTATFDLHKSSKVVELDNLSLPALFMGSFLKQSKGSFNAEVTLLDICSGKMDHLNLKHVSRLESKLCKLYKNMVCLKETLAHQSSSAVLTSDHVAQPVRDRLGGHVTTVTDLLKDCCEDLLSLSVLYPAAPWPPLQKVIHKDLTEESIMLHMPDVNRKKKLEIQSVVQALMKSFSFSKHMLSLEIKILKEELSFHQKVYECQVDYGKALLSAVSEAYREFESNLKELLCKPLQDVLRAYDELKDEASEDGLRNFLVKFKDHAGQLLDALQSLDSHKQEQSEGPSVLSQFHTHFLDNLHSLTRQCVANRDMLMSQLLGFKDTRLNESATLADIGT